MKLETINHYNDSLFKDNLHYCRKLLKTLLISVCNDKCSRHHFWIKEISFLDPETKTTEDVKKSINDLLIKITTTAEEEIVCDIELQTYPEGKKSLCVRVRHYAYNLFSRNKLKKGQSYKGKKLPNLLQIWFLKDEVELFSKYPEIYHFCVQGIDSRNGVFFPGLSQDDHFININYFEDKSRDSSYNPESDLEHIMMFFTCKSEYETEKYVKFHNKPYLKELLENEKSFFDNEDNLEMYMKLEELEEKAKSEEKARKKAEAKAKFEENARKKAEADKAKAEAEAKAKDEALQRSEAKNAKLLAILAENGINISSD